LELKVKFQPSQRHGPSGDGLIVLVEKVIRAERSAEQATVLIAYSCMADGNRR
jgi:hypothetical protein